MKLSARATAAALVLLALLPLTAWAHANLDRAEPAGDPPGVYRLLTVRSDSQFNTTIYDENDRFRGIEGGRRVVLMHEADMARLDLRSK